MKIVTPEQWYRIYWTLMGLGFLGAAYWVIKWAVMAALMDLGSMRPL